MNKKTVLMLAERKQMLLSYLGISEKEWDKICIKKPELATLKPEMLIRHCQENAKDLGFDHQTWVSLCQKAPQLFEMNLTTLRKHITENSELMGISESDWVKICKSEPGLLTYNSHTLEKNIQSSATALGIPEDKWREVCAKRGVLLTYKPETLLSKIDKFIEYVQNPKALLKTQSEPTETMTDTLTNFKGISLERSKVLNAFLRHPNNFVRSPEKMAYSFAYISKMAKAFGINEKPERFLAYIDLSVESNLKMHYLYACLNHHKNKKISLFTLMGEKKGKVKKALLNTIMAQRNGPIPQTDEEIISAYPCPFLQQIKKNRTRSS